MHDTDKTKDQLMQELAAVRERLAHYREAQDERDEQFGSIAELTPDAVLIFDQDGVVSYWNNGAVRIFGYSKEEMLGKSAYVLIPERYKEANSRGLQKALESGSLGPVYRAMETWCIKKDGTEIPVESSTSVWQKEGRAFIGSIVRDISERKRLEAELKQSQEQLERLVKERTAELVHANEQLQREVEERKRSEDFLRTAESRYRAVFENTGTAMVILGEDTIIRMANTEAEKLTGYSKKEIEGRKSWGEFIHKDDLEKMMQYHRMRGQDPASVPQSYEHRLVDRWGAVKNIHLTVGMIPETGLRIGSLIDITDRKRAEEERMRLTSILESTNDFVASARLDYSLTYMNGAGRKMLGWPDNQDITGKSIADVHPRWAQEIILNKAVPAALRFGVWSGETAVIGYGGAEIPVSQVFMSHKGKNEEVEYFSTIIRDISGIKAAEKALRESEERYRSVVETATDAIITVNEHGNIAYWNQGAERTYGYEEDEIIGTSIKALMPERSQALHMDWLHKVLSGEKTTTSANKTSEGIAVNKNGKEFPVEFSGSAWGFGNEHFYTLIVRDNTARKQADQERIRLVTAIEQAAESILIMNPDGTVLYANPATTLQSGYCIDELIEKNTFVPQAKGYDKAYFKSIFEPLQNGKTWTGRLTFTNKDGSLRYLEQTLSPIFDDSGHIINLLSISRDISKEVKLEEQLRQAQKMEAIGTLAGGIAHDFNNILAAIMGYTEMSLYELPEESPAKHNLSLILKSTLRARDLVRQILTFSRKNEQERKPLHISIVVHEAVKLLRASIPTTIEIRETIVEESGIVIADPTQVHQVLVNLCANAAQAMQEKGGVLGIDVAPVVLGADDVKTYPDLPPGPYVRLTVSDTGTGIDPLILNRIFDPFFTTKEVGKGTGMGLAVVHGIVKSYGGAITVESEPGRGTTFRIVVPRGQETLRSEEEDDNSLPAGNERILFIDDEALLIDIGKEMLEMLGYSVSAHENSTEALQLFQQNPFQFDLVITDQTMPHMTGYEFARKILKIRPDIPVILCTGFSETVSEVKAKALGIQGFVMKPMKLHDLAAEIRRVLDAR